MKLATRLARADDLEALERLERFVNPCFQVSREELQSRLSEAHNGAAAGALVLTSTRHDAVSRSRTSSLVSTSSESEAVMSDDSDETRCGSGKGGAVSGVLYFVRANKRTTHRLRYASVFQHADAEGDTVFWVHLVLDPQVRDLLNEFHAAARAYCFETLGVANVRALTHCSDLAQGQVSSLWDLEDYVKLAQRTDRNLFLHSSHGAAFAGVIPAYNPRDTNNAGYAVVMQYTSESSALPASGTTAANGSTGNRLPVSQLREFVHEIIGMGRFDPHRPWFEMGFDSVSLMTLHGKLETALGEQLGVSFLFGANTFAKMAEAIGIQDPADELRVDDGTPATETRPGQGFPGHAESATLANADFCVLGIGLRFPNRVGAEADLETIEAFWTAMLEDDGQDASYKRLVQRDRFANAFLDKGISPEQARCIPLAQRLALETTHAALADAPPGLLDAVKRRVGVFVGAWDGGAGDFSGGAEGESYSAHAAAAASSSILANRISYMLDLCGPSVVVDTACSSSLVALDYACKSIADGACEAALVLGINVVSEGAGEARTKLLRQGGFLSSRGACFAFDSRADGYARSEGAGAILIARANVTPEAGVFARARVRGVAVNQDGRTANLHAPNPNAQTDLIRSACASASIAPHQVTFVQTHGTGTRLGDPIEASGLRAALRPAEGPALADRPLYLASIKSQFGHLEGAAGIIGLVAAVLALQARELPPNRRLKNVNPDIPFSAWNLAPASRDAAVRLPQQDVFAGVSSFGFGGTNAHAILQAVSDPCSRAELTSRGAIPWAQKSQLIPFAPALTSALDVGDNDALGKKLQDHRLGALEVIPGSFWVALAAEMHPGAFLQELSFRAVTQLPVPREWGVSLQRASKKIEFINTDGTVLCDASVHYEHDRKSEPLQGLDQARARCSHAVDLSSFYEQLGNRYGPRFQAMQAAWDDETGAVVAQLSATPIENAAAAAGRLERAVLIDAAAHACFLAFKDREAAAAPHFADGFASVWCDPAWARADPGTAPWWCVVRRQQDDLVFDWDLFSASGKLVVAARGFTLGRTRPSRRQPSSQPVLCQSEWQQLTPEEAARMRRVQPEVIVDEPCCETLHKRILGLLTAPSRPRVCIRVHDSAQEGYIRSLRREEPSWPIHMCCGPDDVSVVAFAEEPEVLLTGPGQLAVRRLVPLAKEALADSLVRPVAEGTYLITGGGGAIGLHLASELRARGAGNVVLLGRSPRLQELPQGVEYLQCDVSDRAALARIVGPFSDKIRGVIHCAGVLRDGIIANLPGFREVFAGKVHGAEALMETVNPLSDTVDFFVFCSSVTACLGSAGQANYAAANAALDGLAEAAASDKVVSVQWGPWQGAQSMASSSATRWQRLGLPPMSPQAASDALFALPRACGPVVCVTCMDSHAPGAASAWAQEPLVRDLLKSHAGGSAADQQLALSDEVQGGRQLVRRVASAFFADGELEDETTPWRDAGLDSLAMVEFRNMLRAAVPAHVVLRDTVLFDYPNPLALATYLEEATAGSSPVTRSKTAARPAHSQGTDGALAVTGVACRLPGNVDSPHALWELLQSGRDTMTDIPLGRFDWEDAPDRLYARKAAFVSHADRFDAARFKIPLVEAQQMDPQQRLALTMAADALSDAEISPEARVGVFVGVMTNDWARLMDPAKPTAYSAAGQIPCVLANRISYALGLQGPSMAIDTACSSSLVALDMAAAAMSRGDCDAAIVVGVNLILDSGVHAEECAARMLSTAGRCATFSESADGYARGEGCVALVVEPAGAVAATKKPSWGTVLATAVNQDGRSANLTSPNGRAQVDVIQRALERAQLVPADISYVETHGTGTPLGDPIEVGALSDALAQHPGQVCLGALKTVIGHGEAVAGLSGVLKALLCIEHGEVPPNLHQDCLNPKVQEVAAPWMRFPRDAPHRLPPRSIAGVSAFGFGGTNAHVVLAGSKTPTRARDTKRGSTPGPRLPWTLDNLVYRMSWTATDKETVVSAASGVHVVRSVEDVRRVITGLNPTRNIGDLTFACTDRPTCALIRSLQLARPKWKIRLVQAGDDIKIAGASPEQRITQDGAILVPRLEKASHFVPYSLDVEQMGAVVVSGASGGIGRAVLQSLANAGVRDLVALSRSGASIDIPGVQTLACDVSVAADVERVADRIGRNRVQLVLHVAGILKERTIEDLNAEDIASHNAAKVQGTRNLAASFAQAKLVGFSSTSSIFGMRDAPAYAMANAAMEEVIDDLRAHGRQAASLRWDLWKETGMAHARSMGSDARGLSTRRACQILIGILQTWDAEHDPNGLIVMSADLMRLHKTLANPSLFDGLVSASEEILPVERAIEVSALERDLRRASPQERSKVLESWLLAEARQRQSQAEIELTVTTSWQQVGFDSLSMTEFTALLNEALGLQNTPDELSDTVMFDYPTPRNLAQHASRLWKPPQREKHVDPCTEVNDEEALEPGAARSTDDEATIVSMALRFPGSRENSSPEAFWKFLCSGGDAMRDIPRTRIPSLATTAEGDGDYKNVYVRRGGFLHPDLFEADIRGSFPFSDAEVLAMDPHQRVALQVAGEALESARAAGADMENVGVFVGAQNTEYMLSQADKVGTFTATGTALSIIANRISFAFDLTGPSMTVDTACSSSLVALDAALKALRAGDCSSALVLAVDLMLSPHRFETTCAARMLSPQGRCATFSDGADGYARGEGCGAIVLTIDASAALPAWGVVRGIALNQDGKSANLTSPRGPAQVKCIETALRRAGVVDVDEVAFVEAHGTGTKLGDPQELEALATVFAGRREPLYVGAVKSSIGHLEAAAGLAGIIKTVLCLKHNTLPPNLHCQRLNPRVAKLQNLCPFAFPSEVTSLREQTGTTQIAGVSSFGFGGTNGHVVLASVPAERAARAAQCFRASGFRPRVLDLRPSAQGTRWHEALSSELTEVIRNHRVGSLAVLPATSYMELVQPLFQGKALAFTALDLRSMYFIPQTGMEFDLELDEATQRVSIRSLPDNTLRAVMHVLETSLEDRRIDVASLSKKCTNPLPSGEALYQGIGNAYGGPFKAVSQAWANEDQTSFLGKVDLDQSVSADALASAWLDAASHVALAALDPEARAQPVYAEHVEAYKLASAKLKREAASDAFVWSCIQKTSSNTFNMQICRDSGEILAEVHQFRFGFFARAATRETSHRLWADTWREITHAPGRAGPETEIVTIDEPHAELLLARLARMLRADPTQSAVIIARTPEHRGLVACARREYPRATLVTASGDGFPGAGLLVAAAQESGTWDLRTDASGRVRGRSEEVLASAPKDAALVRIVRGGTYVVTGGAGALGKQVGAAITERGGLAVLLGRSESPLGGIPDGCRYVRCDTTDAEAVSRTLAGLPGLRGIFHCAGVLADATLQSAKPEDLAKVSAPKMQGADAIMASGVVDRLDFLVLFSSIAGSAGSAGQAVYGAANAALDALAEREHDRGLPILSIRWGPWGGAGMAAELSAKWARMKLRPLAPAVALDAMFTVPRGHAVVTICEYEDDAPATAAGARTAPVPQRSWTAESLRKMVLETAQEVSPDHSQIGVDDPWREAGLDSLAMVEFRNLLQDRVGEGASLQLEETVLFDYPTPRALVEMLAEVVPQSTDASAGSQISASPAVCEDVVSATPSTVVTGAACRLPGGANSLENFWKLLCSGKDAMQAVPASRFDMGPHFDADPSTPGKTYVDKGAFVDDVYSFDNEKFGISALEAARMDPQQRLTVECAFEAMVSAGLLAEGEGKPAATSRNVGVYVGMMTNDWASMEHGAPSPFTATGHSPAVAANRISYLFGLTGPSMTIDTACSSSLVALDAARRSLEAGECDAAVVVGVNLILSPQLYIEECAARMLSPRGYCSTFSADADGYARGEGCVAVVLQRRDDPARRPALAEILGSAVNQDGRSANITSPNGRAQEAVIRAALQRANVAAEEIAYVETHGTGTALGDPLEVSALARVFADRSAPLVLGAAKATVGHTEGASGLTGFLKAVLCLHHSAVPGTASLAPGADAKLNPKVAKVALPQMRFPGRGELVALDARARVGVSSFGFGGTNAHVILGGSAEEVGTMRRNVVTWARKKFAPVGASRAVMPGKHAPIGGANSASAYAPQVFGMPVGLPSHEALDLFLWEQAAQHADQQGQEYHSLQLHTVLEPLEGEAVMDLENGSVSVAAANKDLAVVCSSSIATQEASSTPKISASRAEPISWESQSVGWFRERVSALGWRQESLLATSIEVSQRQDAIRLGFPRGVFSHRGFLFAPGALSTCILALGLAQAWEHESQTGIRMTVPPTLASVQHLWCAAANDLVEMAAQGSLRCTACADGSLVLEDEADGRLLLELQGARCEFGQGFGATTRFQRMWRPSLLAETQRPLLRRNVGLAAAQRHVNPRETLDVDGDEALEQYCAGHIRKALSTLPIGFVPSEPHLQHLLRRWQHTYGVERKVGKALAPSGVEYEFARNCMDALSDIMQGKRAALDVLFSKPELTTRLYSESTPSMTCNRAIAQGVQGVAEAVYAGKSGSKVLRILELGAGTGGTTMHVVDLLDIARTEYVFTDISDYFLRQAEDTFAPYSDMMRYALLNVEMPLGPQGFAPGQFDIIIASNIIHATQELRVTLGHVADLLVPGGVFLLNEATVSTAFLDATFGLTSGWWRFAAAQDEARPGCDGPLLAPSKWSSLLQSNGFESFEVLHKAAQGQAVMAAVRERETVVNEVVPPQRLRLAIAGDDGDDALTRALRESSPATLQSADADAFVVVASTGVTDTERGVREWFDALQSFASRRRRERALVVVTRQTECPLHASLWGMARSMGLEAAELERIVCMDADTDSRIEDIVAAVHAELRRAERSRVSQIRLICGERHEGVLQTNALAKAQTATAELGGTYVITGGLGGLGLLTAVKLLERGVRSLVLVSRSGTLRTGDASAALEASLMDRIHEYEDAELRFVACNVRSREELERKVFDRIDADDRLPRVQGIIHAAGILRNRAISRMDWTSEFVPVFETKAQAALHLDAIARERGYALRHFVLYSSAASTFGSAGQSNHAAANAVMDAVAAQRRAHGLCGTAVQWGGWDDLGAAVASQVARDTVLGRGMGLLTMENGACAIEDILGPEVAPVLGISAVAWPTFGPQQADDVFLAPFYKAPRRAMENAAPESSKEISSDAPGESPTTDAQAEALALVESMLKDCGIHDMVASLADQGLDSLTSIELIALVRDRTGVKLSPTFYLDYVNGQGLAAVLAPTLVSETSSPEAPTELTPPPTTARSKNGLRAAAEPVASLEASAWLEPLFAPKLRLFCFAYAGGHPNVFREWMGYIPASVQICPVAMPGYGKQTHRAFWQSIPELADRVAASLPTDVPFALAGSCLGAIISFEVVRSLRRTASRLPEHHFAIACSAPQDYARALRLLYSHRLKENAFFVPSDEAHAAVRFQDLPVEEREDTVRDLHQLGFFKDDETLANLRSNKVYFEHVMAQIAGQMQLAERYTFDEGATAVAESERVPITAISGRLDDTIPEGWPRAWESHAPRGRFRHVEILEGGHYILQTHAGEVTRAILDDLQ